MCVRVSNVTHTDTPSLLLLVLLKVTIGSKTEAVRQRNARNAHVSYTGTKHTLVPTVVVHARTKTISGGVHLTIGALMLVQFARQFLLPFACVVVPMYETPHLHRCVFAPSCGRNARRRVAPYETFPHLLGPAVWA